MQTEFYEQVKSALEGLHDYSYLERHPLALRCWPDERLDGPSRGQRLHRLLLESIEALNPLGASPASSTEARYYLLLVRRYIEGRDPAEVMDELAYGRRQFFRAQRKALLSLATCLLEALPQQASPGRTDDILAVEAEPVLARQGLLAPAEIIQGVLSAVEALARARGVLLEFELAAGLHPIRGNRTLLRQVLLKVLSNLITQPGTRKARVRMYNEGQQVIVELVRVGPAAPEAGTERAHQAPLETERRLVEMMGGRWHGPMVAPERDTLRFELPSGEPRVVLAVEDNEPVVRAFRRYLAGYGIHVIGVNNGPEALRLAQELQPVAITLDLMMPVQDGWEVLQALKSVPATRHIPVIVCSVLDDPELARSLGAAGYLHKPVSQADLLSAVSPLLPS